MAHFWSEAILLKRFLSILLVSSALVHAVDDVDGHRQERAQGLHRESRKSRMLSYDYFEPTIEDQREWVAPPVVPVVHEQAHNMVESSPSVIQTTSKKIALDKVPSASGNPSNLESKAQPDSLLLTDLEVDSIGLEHDLTDDEPLVYSEEDSDKRYSETQSNTEVAVANRHIDNQEDTTKAEVAYFLVKWGLIGVLVLIPLVLLPVLFLYVQGGKTNGDSFADDNPPPSSEGSQDQQEIMQFITQPMSLLATIPHRDSYLADHSNWRQPHGSVTMDEQTSDLFYLLTPVSTMVHKATGQLYHPSTGLWFNPIQDCFFDAAIGACVNQKDHVSANPDPNLVYEPSTNRLYERCLSVCCHPNEAGTVRWSLPATLNAYYGRPKDAIRRVKPDELPPFMAGPYSNLLIEWLQQQVPIKQVHQSSEPNLSPMMTQQQQQQHNPLVLTKRDFDNQYVWDLEQVTPRCSLQSQKHLFKITAPPAAEANLKPNSAHETPLSPREQPTVYMDALSRVVPCDF